MKLLIKITLAAFILLGSEVQAQPVVVNFSSLDLPLGVQLRDANTLLIESGHDIAVEIPLQQSLQQLSGQKIWIRSEIRSSRDRTAVHFNNGVREVFSYHSGDGTSQLLLAESELMQPLSTATVKIIASENHDSKGVVVVGPIVISRPQEQFGPAMKLSTRRWARTNNPNHDSWFDRYASQRRNFSVTIPHLPGFPTWERYFGMGVNDRFSTGDYYCYPDDMLILGLADGSRAKAYLGLLPWIRTVHEIDDQLVLKFVYHGELQPAADVSLHPNIQDEAAAQWTAPRGVQVHLSKEYLFHTNRGYAVVKIAAKVLSAGKVAEAMWIVQDAAYMDFLSNDSVDVHGLRNGRLDEGGAWFRSSGSAAPRLVQYRLRSERQSMAAFYRAPDADFAFMLPKLFARGYLTSGFKGDQQHPIDKIIGFELPRESLEEPWMFGVGFKFNALTLTERTLEMHYLDGFSNTAGLQKLVAARNE